MQDDLNSIDLDDDPGEKQKINDDDNDAVKVAVRSLLPSKLNLMHHRYRLDEIVLKERIDKKIFHLRRLQISLRVAFRVDASRKN